METLLDIIHMLLIKTSLSQGNHLNGNLFSPLPVRSGLGFPLAGKSLEWKLLFTITWSSGSSFPLAGKSLEWKLPHSLYRRES